MAEQAIVGVAGSISPTIADLNLAGLAAAAVSQPLIGEGLQRAIKVTVLLAHVGLSLAVLPALRR